MYLAKTFDEYDMSGLESTAAYIKEHTPDLYSELSILSLSLCVLGHIVTLSYS